MTFLGNKENSDDLYWGIKTWEALNGETRTIILFMLGNNSVGRMFILSEKSGALGCMPNYWGIILVGDKTRS